MAEEQSNTENMQEEGAVQEAAPLSPLMQSVVDGIRAALPEFEPIPRNDGWVELNIPREKWLEAAKVLRNDPRLGFDYLSMVSAVDYQEKGFQVVYHLLSLMANKKLVVKVDAPERDRPTVPSITQVWPTANFHEREAWDMMGIVFEGHPNLKRILMRDDWVGHPLRKDYVDERAPRERVTKETYGRNRGSGERN